MLFTSLTTSNNVLLNNQQKVNSVISEKRGRTSRKHVHTNTLTNELILSRHFYHYLNESILIF